MNEQGRGGFSAISISPVGRKRQKHACVRGGGRTAEVLFLREATKYKLVSLVWREDSPVSLSLPLRGGRRGQPVGQRGCPGPAAEQPRAAGEPLPHPHPHPRTLRALPPRPASPPRLGRWAREIQVKEEVDPELLPGPAPSRRRAPGAGRSGTGPGALRAAGGRRRPSKPGLPSLHFNPEIWKWKLFDV